MTTQINGVNIPGQWLTPEYVIEHQIQSRYQLRALGNGVVPQQGATAITHLLGRS